MPYLCLDVRKAPLYDEDGRLVGTVGCARDVTLERATERALRESEGLFSALVKYATAGIALLDETSRIHFANDYFAAMVQAKTAAELIGRSYLDFVHPDDRSGSAQRLAANIAGIAATRREHRLVGLAGRMVTVESAGVQVQHQNRSHVMGVFHDITERKNHEMQLHQLSSIVEQASDSIIRTDQDFYITYMNRSAEQLSGYSLQEALGKRPDLFSYRLSKEPFQTNDWAKIVQERRELEYINRSRSGQEQYVRTVISPIYDLQGQLSGYVGFCRDITEYKNAAKVLQESEERYRALMMQSHDAVLLVDLDSLEIVEANPRFESMTGYRLSAERPLHVFDLMEDTKDNVLRQLEELFATGSLPPTVRKIRTREGRRLLVERTGSLVKAGGRNYQLATFRDVTIEMERQYELKKDLVLAAQVQRALLPTTPRSEHFVIDTLYRSKGFVSGDVYHLEWKEPAKILRGFLLDITGHGLATALQTSAVSVLLHELMDLPISIALAEQLAWLNRRIPQYIDETSFAAAIAFELDFSSGELRCAAAGITEFLINNIRITLPGLFLGINVREPYEMKRFAFSPGDSICFMTDGITDVLAKEKLGGAVRARDICKMFDESIYAEKLADDATAICIITMKP